MEDFFTFRGVVEDADLKVVSKKWGFERIIANGPYCLKELHLCKGKRCSYHYHRLKDETFLLVSGNVIMVYAGDQEDVPDDAGLIEAEYMVATHRWLVSGDVFHVPRFMRHQFIGLDHSLIIEASTQHFDDDSYRLIEGG